ncbi:hypothetical protein KCU90_g4113, partial [Aureobasidium melanogenum]
MPVARIARGNNSGNMTILGTAVKATNTASTATTDNKTGTVGEALIIKKAGYTATINNTREIHKTRLRPTRSDNAPANGEQITVTIAAVHAAHSADDIGNFKI